LHPAAFSEIFHQRWINNIYFDTPGLNSYWDNVCGSEHRIKSRIRWYGELLGPIPGGTLELKVKHGVVGHKLAAPVGRFKVDRNLDELSLSTLLEDADLDPDIRKSILTTQPVLINRYQRRYFLSADRKFRLTMDTNMEYVRFDSGPRFSNRVSGDGLVILELKYDVDHDDLADAAAGYFPFRISKSSKYVTGLSLVRR
jgi:SPX domain protein involved in polyphosphate accumulation